ncbi:KHG/KDPG aldolase [Peptococcaceae bacterium CEB3]|nr:KHG/KDPG aldolase [Peptococcaceae bacterium CEB3]
MVTLAGSLLPTFGTFAGLTTVILSKHRIGPLTVPWTSSRSSKPFMKAGLPATSALIMEDISGVKNVVSATGFTTELLASCISGESGTPWNQNKGQERMRIMAKKEEIISRIKAGGLVAVIRAESTEQAFKITEACIAGGVAAIEITFTVPGAADLIKELAAKYKKGPMIIGAGTVLDPESARAAILAGAEYIVSPSLNVETVRLCNRYRVPCTPGAMTAKEVVECLEAGADIVKIFPGELFGPAIIKAIRGPLPQADLMPTGGVSLENVSEWIKAGAVAVGVGGSLTAGAKTGDYESITRTAREFMEKIKAARAQ